MSDNTQPLQVGDNVKVRKSGRAGTLPEFGKVTDLWTDGNGKAKYATLIHCGMFVTYTLSEIEHITIPQPCEECDGGCTGGVVCPACDGEGVEVEEQINE